jgi:hypothetical protein
MVELEFVSVPPNSQEYLAECIEESICEQKINHSVQIRGWEHTYNNENTWVCKTDSSCGYEVCTPPLYQNSTVKLAVPGLNAVVGIVTLGLALTVPPVLFPCKA